MPRRILLVWTDISTVGLPRYHAGVSALAAAARRAGCEVGLHAPLTQDSAAFIAQVDAFSPDVVAFSVASPQWRHNLELGHALREQRPGLLSLIGGPHASFAPQRVIDSGVFDGLCRGEGEHVFEALAVCDPTVDALAELPGMWVLGSSGAISRQPLADPIEDLSGLALPDRELFDIPAILRDTGRLAILTSRRDPYAYEGYGHGAPSRVRRHTPQQVVDEISGLIERFPQTTTIHLQDDIFDPPADWLAEFAERYRRAVDRPFWVTLAVDHADPQMMRGLRHAGDAVAVFRVDCGSEWVRRHVLGRTSCNRQIREAFSRARSAGLRTGAIAMVGLPHETPGRLEETRALLAQINPDELGAMIYTPYPGTRLYETCRERGWLTREEQGDPFERSILRLPELPPDRIRDCFMQLTEDHLARRGGSDRLGAFDFTANLTSAKVEAADPSEVRLTVYINSYSAPWILAQPPTRIEYDCTIPYGCRLAFDIGLRGGNAGASGSARFSVSLDGQTVFSRELYAESLRRDRPWVSGQVDLSQWAGRRVKLGLQTEKTQQPLKDVAAVGWGSLRLESDGAVTPPAESRMRLPAMWREIVQFRHLLLALAFANFKIRYRNAILGIGWSLAIPFALFLVFMLLFKPIFDIQVEHYALFLMAALFPWTFLASSVSETINLLPGNSTFIKANRFPHEVLPLATVLTQFVNLLFAYAILLVYVVAGPIGPGWQLLWLAPSLLLLVLLTSGLCLLFSALDACYKDVSYLVEVSMLAWFFLTPIFYPISRVRDRVGSVLEWLIVYNPLTPLVDGFRYALQGGAQAPSLVYPAVVSVGVFLFGCWAFRRLEARYVDIL